MSALKMEGMTTRGTLEESRYSKRESQNMDDYKNFTSCHRSHLLCGCCSPWPVVFVTCISFQFVTRLPRYSFFVVSVLLRRC